MLSSSSGGAVAESDADVLRSASDLHQRDQNDKVKISKDAMNVLAKSDHNGREIRMKG